MWEGVAMVLTRAVVRVIGLSVCGLLLAACAPVPRPTTYPYTFQPQMQAAEHWQALAVQMVERVPSRDEAVYLPEDPSSFGRALRAFLASALTQRGIALAQTEEVGVTLAWDTQLVAHGGWRHKPHLPFPGFVLEPVVFLFSPGVATGWLPHHEVIVTTTIRRRDHLLWQHADIFYVPDGDAWHYLPPSVIRPVPACDHAVVRVQCPFYQYREGVYRARCEDGSMVVVSLGSTTVVPPRMERPKPWQAEACTLLAAAIPATR
jgi:hypothetical protein